MIIARREFVMTLGGAALWPLAADAQQAMPVIGVLSGASGAGFGDVVTAFKESLSQEGYLENRDATMRRLDKKLPSAAYEVLDDHSEKGFSAASERLGGTIRERGAYPGDRRR